MCPSQLVWNRRETNTTIKFCQTGVNSAVPPYLAEESVVPERELVPGDELSFAGDASEAVDVVDLRFGTHHEIVLTETQATLVTLCTE